MGRWRGWRGRLRIWEADDFASRAPSMAPRRHSGQAGRLVRFRGGWFCAVSPHGDALTGTRESPVLLVRSPLKRTGGIGTLLIII